MQNVYLQKCEIKCQSNLQLAQRQYYLLIGFVILFILYIIYYKNKITKPISNECCQLAAFRSCFFGNFVWIRMLTFAFLFSILHVNFAIMQFHSCNLYIPFHQVV